MSDTCTLTIALRIIVFFTKVKKQPTHTNRNIPIMRNNIYSIDNGTGSNSVIYHYDYYWLHINVI